MRSCRGGYGDNGSNNSENRIGENEILSTPVTPFIDKPSPAATKEIALILMDSFAFYHGRFLAHRAKVLYGITIVPVFSNYMKGFFQMQQPPDMDHLMSMCMPSEEEKEAWLKPLEGFELLAVLCESDSGLADAERLESLLNTTFQNGFNEARRNKYMMIEKIREAGIPVVKQKLCCSVEEAQEAARELGIEEYKKGKSTPLEQLTSTFVVVKPVRGVGSEDVSLCQSIASVEKAFHQIYGGTVFGSPREKHQSALVQEFAEGQEFAIDVVSKNGEHKVAAVWKYDKRPANGASFVYFATELYNGPEVAEISDYLRRCLDALQISWGITHSEIIMTARGPRLVEVNCRQHNMDFLPLTMECIGYNVFDMLLTAYLGDKDPDIFPLGPAAERLDWELLPLNPSVRMCGAMIHLACFANGTLTHVNEDALKEIQNMDSVVDLEVYPAFLHVGNEIQPTTDIKTDAGWAQLIHPDPDQFQKDYDRIIELMPCIFEAKT
ncbi:unnamed protein product [Cylindrotheca closterium]|uniref:ATP-grasp domain-containing protein n=1 Tax=Cylindrotheca closterium TaxID=2856 RepID=A0AAD2CLF9_9STRA|nr:unnamed protein product [Cylindrotheca closterium]